MSKVMQTFNKR